jgi:hypothetical protein
MYVTRRQWVFHIKLNFITAGNFHKAKPTNSTMSSFSADGSQQKSPLTMPIKKEILW